MYEIICCFTLVPDSSPLGHRMDLQRVVNTALAVFAALVAQPLRSNIHDRWALLVATLLLLLMRQIHRAP